MTFAKRLLILIFLGSCWLGCARHVVIKETVFYPSAEEALTPVKPVNERPAFGLPAHEKLVYRVKWLGIPAGTIIASIKGIETVEGRRAYVLEVKVQTTGVVNAIYKIDDTFISYMDVEHLYTLKHRVSRREGRYQKDAVTVFDQVHHKAYFENFLDGSKKTFDIPDNVQDTLSAAYYFRTRRVNVGEQLEYKVCNNEENYDLFALADAVASIAVPALKGRRDAVHLQPYAKLKGQDVKKGKVSGYFSYDEKRIPLLATVEAPMFTKVSVILYEAQFK